LLASSALAFAAGDSEREEDRLRRAAVMMRRLDRDMDSRVDAGEFLQLVEARMEDENIGGESERMKLVEYYSAFHAAADLDSDGGLTLRELEFLSCISDHHMPPIHSILTGVWSSEQGFGQHLGEEPLTQYDVSGDGRLDEVEFRRSLDSILQLWDLGETEPEVDDWLSAAFAHADVDGNKFLTARENHFALLLLAEDLQSGDMHHIRLRTRMFKDLDANLDGVIDLAEVDAGIARPDNAANKQAIFENLYDFFDKIDTNSDGVVDASEMSVFTEFLATREKDG